MQSTVWGLLDEAANSVPDQTFLAFGERAWSYRSFREEAQRVARAFGAAGIEAGDRVCLFLPNTPEFLHLMFGAARAGVIIAPANPTLRSAELAYQVRHSGARLIFTVPELEDAYGSLAEDVPDLEGIVCLGEVTPRAASTPYDEWLGHGDQLVLPPPPDDGELVLGVLYTSGTTGDPKGAMITNRGYVQAGRAIAALGIRDDDVLMTCLPLYHLNAEAYSVMGTLAARASLVLEPRFSATAWWDEVRRREVTIFNGIGAMIAMLLAQPQSDSDRDHAVRFVITTVPAELWCAFEERFGATIVSGFSQTESILGCLTHPDEEAPVGSVGKPLPGIELRLVDDEGHDVEPGVVGEALFRPEGDGAIMAGYFRDPERTAEVIVDDWLHTGDYLRRDDKGFCFFVDRKKDIVRRGGENISSAEVEGVLVAHPKVLEAAVIAVPDPIRIEEVKAFVRLLPGETQETASPEHLFHWCEERLAGFKVPRYLEYRDDEFPKTPTMRVRKVELRAERADQLKGCYDRSTGSWVE